LLFSEVQIETTYGAALLGSDTREPFVTAWDIGALNERHNKVAIKIVADLKEVELFLFILFATPHFGNFSVQIFRR
jgi:hypothetical protein